jgi:hypothetical protein
MFFRLLSVAKPLKPLSFKTTLDVSFLDHSLTFPLIFYLLRTVPVETFKGFPLSLLANVIDLIDLIDLFESTEHLLLVSNGSGLSLNFSINGAANGSGFRDF